MRARLVVLALTAACSGSARPSEPPPLPDARLAAPPDAAARPPVPADAAPVAIVVVDAAVADAGPAPLPPIELGSLIAPDEPASQARAGGKAGKGRADLAIVEDSTALTLWKGKKQVARVPGDFRGIAFSPDGSVIAAKAQAGPFVLISADDGDVLGTMVTDQDTGWPHWLDDRHLLATSEHELWVHDLEQPDSPRVALRDPTSRLDGLAVHAGTGQAAVRAGDQLHVLHGTDAARAIGPGGWPSFSADGARLVWDADGSVIVWNLAQAAVERTFATGDTDRASWAVSAYADRIAIDEDDIMVRELSSGTEIARYHGMGSGFELAEDGAHLLVTFHDSEIQVFPIAGKDATIQRVEQGEHAMLLGDGSEVLVWKFGPDLTVYRARDGKQLRGYTIKEGIGAIGTSTGRGVASIAHARAGAAGRKAAIVAAAADPATPMAFFAMGNGRIGFADLDRAAIVASPALVGGSTQAIDVTADGRWLAISDDRRVHLLDLKSGTITRVLAGHTDDITSLAFSPDGKKLATSSYDGTVRIWSMPGGKQTKKMGEYGRYLDSLAWSPDGKRLAWVAERQACVWSSGAPSCVETDGGHFGSPSVRFTPDGKTLVLATSSSLFTRPARSTGAFEERYEIYGLSDLALSADGTVAFGVRGHTSLGAIDAWSLGDGAERWAYDGYVGHESGSAVNGKIALTADGSRVVLTGFYVPELRILDAATGKQLASIPASPPGWPAIAAH